MNGMLSKDAIEQDVKIASQRIFNAIGVELSALYLEDNVGFWDRINSDETFKGKVERCLITLGPLIPQIPVDSETSKGLGYEPRPD